MLGEAELMIQEIAQAMFVTSRRLPLQVISARQFPTAAKPALTKFFERQYGATSVIATYQIGPDLKGGFVAYTPVSELDTSVKTKLNQLKAHS